jgi:hypothetical protein
MNPKLSLSLLAAFVVLALIATVVGASAQEAPDATVAATPDIDALQQAYQAQIAANAAPPTNAPDPLTDEELAANNFGCPDGTAFWLRDPETPLCTPLCTSDADCGPGEGRCRLLDVGDKSLAPPLLLVDEMSADDVSRVVANSNPTAVPLCDPFVGGAPDTAGVVQ